MDSRTKILAAAAEVFARHGFRGATTRLIAQQAGVNEVTIFRTFGSKERLLAEAVHRHASGPAIVALPTEPSDPLREISEWSAAQLEHLRSSRALIRTCMGELEERPSFAPEVACGPYEAGQQLRSYLDAMIAKGMMQHSSRLQAAVAMLLGACFSDAMGRDMMPSMFPQPPEQAAAVYTELFLRSVGFDVAARQRAPRPTSREQTLRRTTHR